MFCLFAVYAQRCFQRQTLEIFGKSSGSCVSLSDCFVWRATSLASFSVAVSHFCIRECSSKV